MLNRGEIVHPPLRIIQGRNHTFQLCFDEQAHVAGCDVAADRRYAALVAMTHAKRIVHKRISAVRQCLCEFGVISFVTLVKSRVFKQ